VGVSSITFADENGKLLHAIQERLRSIVPVAVLMFHANAALLRAVTKADTGADESGRVLRYWFDIIR
jgi:hypothetical protein